MKKNTIPKKLQLVKVKIASLSQTKKKGIICITSLDQTTCPFCNA
jgi:hypothetical protein